MGDTDSISSGVPKRLVDKALLLLCGIIATGSLYVWAATRASEIKNSQQDQQIEYVNKRLDGFDAKLDKQDVKLDRIFEKVK